jgi:hypothetical protein
MGWRKLQEIQGRLTENDVTSYINQLSVPLHRCQLGMQTLNVRNSSSKKNCAHSEHRHSACAASGHVARCSR